MEPNNQPYYDQESPGLYEMELQGGGEQQQALYLAKVMAWMCAGLFTTLLSTIICLNVTPVWMFMLSGVGYIAIFAIQLILVIAFSAGLKKMSAPAATVLFLLYSAFTGATFTLLYFIFTLESLLFVFGVTGLTFLMLAIYGFATKKDLTRLGSLCMMGLFGIIISSLINVFILKSEAVDLVVCCVGIVLFIGLIAFDTQKIKGMYTEAMSQGHDEGSDIVRKIAISGAFTLYLDFINLFLRLLRILGNRRR